MFKKRKQRKEMLQRIYSAAEGHGKFGTLVFSPLTLVELIEAEIAASRPQDTPPPLTKGKEKVR